MPFNLSRIYSITPAFRGKIKFKLNQDGGFTAELYVKQLHVYVPVNRYMSNMLKA